MGSEMCIRDRQYAVYDHAYAPAYDPNYDPAIPVESQVINFFLSQTIYYFFMQSHDSTYDPNYAATYHQNYGPSYNQVTDNLILFENIHIRPQQVWSPDATYDPNYSGEIQVTGMISNFATGFQKFHFFWC